MSSRLLLLFSAIVLPLLLPLHEAEGQQGGHLLSATGAVTARARVMARIEPRLLAVESAAPEGGSTVITTRLEVGANVPHLVRARVIADARARVEVQDATGGWVRPRGDAGVVVASGERAGVAEYRITCRVSGRAAACPVSLEIVSVDPAFPLQVSVGGTASAVRVADAATR